MPVLGAIYGSSVLWLVAAGFCAAGAIAGYRSGGFHEPFFQWMSALAVLALLFAFEVIELPE